MAPSFPYNRFLFLLSGLLSIFLVSCASNRDYFAEVSVPKGEVRQVDSLFKGDYLIEEGATLSARFGKGTRFFVKKGGVLPKFSKGMKRCVAYVESGARVAPQKGLTIVSVQDAGDAYSKRNIAALLPRSPNESEPSSSGGGDYPRYAYPYYGGAYYGGGGYHDGYYHRCRKRHNYSSAKIKNSSYKIKQ